MAFEFKLPDVGEGTTEGEIIRWLVSVGDTVVLDQPLVEVETDKAVVELPAPKPGTILARFGEEGETIAVGSTLVLIGQDDEKPPTASSREVLHHAETVPVSQSGTNENQTSLREALHPAVQAAPATRRLAKEAGLDLGDIRGSGPRGRIVPDDVRRARSQAVQPATPRPHESADARHPLVLRGLRKKIADHMALSWQQIPHVTVVEKLDAKALVAFRQTMKAMALQQGLSNLTYLPILTKMIAALVPQYPMFNARWDGQEIFQYDAVHVGIAVDTPEGLVVPVLRHVESMGLFDLARALPDLVERAKGHKLGPDALSGSTITVTGGGALGGLFATPIINHPEVAIIGMYPMVQEAVLVNGTWEEHPMLHISLTFDHRIADGVMASQFLGALKRLLIEPMTLLGYLR